MAETYWSAGLCDPTKSPGEVRETAERAIHRSAGAPAHRTGLPPVQADCRTGIPPQTIQRVERSRKQSPTIWFGLRAQKARVRFMPPTKSLIASRVVRAS